MARRGVPTGDALSAGGSADGVGIAGEIEFHAVELAAGDPDGTRLLAAMKAEMAELYDGLDLDAERMPRAGAAELGPPHGTFLVGRLDGEAVCCGGVKRLEPGVCEIKRMYVAPAVRGQGVARRLLGELEEAARRLGYRVARLDTGDKQNDARHLYESAGYLEIANFNANPVATYFAEKPL
jgi:GNAT superfamily N-acetyltransferase